MKSKQQCKDEVAKLYGYPTWYEYYNWIARDGQLPGVVAQLIEAATEEAMQSYASQSAGQGSEGVEKYVSEFETMFKPYCIDYLSKESEDVTKQKIKFAFDNKDKAFELFQSCYHMDYGGISIDENLVSIHTGGWSDNEEIIYHFKKTLWWQQNLRMHITGGHYYFDTDRQNGAKEWDIIKRNPSDQPLPVSPSEGVYTKEQLIEVASKAWAAGWHKLDSVRASNKPSDDKEPDRETYLDSLRLSTPPQLREGELEDGNIELIKATVKRLEELSKYHLAPYNLGDEGETGSQIKTLSQLVSKL